MLRCITRTAGLDFYRLSSGTYVVIVASEATPGWASLGGFVVDASTGTGLPSARVQLAELPTGTFAGDDGAFTIARLRPGRYAMTVRALGYLPFTTTLDLDANATRRMRVTLSRNETSTRPIIVNGIRPGDASATLGTSVVPGRATHTVMGPSLFLPGAVSPLGVARRDGTGDLHLQGGDAGEHPWRLDGIPLYDVTTLSGLLGTVSPLVVDRLTVHRAGYRASVGSFTAGAIDLTHASGRVETTDRITADVAVDPLTATARVAGPLSIGGVTGRVMVAGRTGLWQWTAPPAMARTLRHWSAPDPVLLARVSGFGALPGMEGLDRTRYATSIGNESVSVNDVHAATTVGWGASHELSLSAFSTSQGIAYDGTAPDSAVAALGSGASGAATLHTTDAYAWRNTGAQLSHRWLIGTRVRQQLQLRTSRHALDHDASMTMVFAAPAPLGIAGGERNTITETTLAADWRVQASSRLSAAFGAEVSRASAELAIANRVLQPLALQSTVWRGTVLADVTARLRSGLFADVGLRVTQLQSGRSYGEPRIALRGESAASGVPWSWRVSAGGYHQFVTQFDVASTMPVAFVPSTRFWLPTDGSTPVAQAWHAAGEGVLRPADGWEVRGEAYMKWLPTIPTFDYGVVYGRNGAATSGTLADAAQFMAGARGRAAGVGVRVVRDARLRSATWRHEVAYDVGFAERRFPSRFGERLQPPPWLEPHRLLAATELALANGLTVAARARGVFGRPWALRQAYYDLFGAAPSTAGLPLDLPGNMTKPAVVDVDVGATWRTRLAGAELELGISVTNAIDRANVLDYGLRGRTDGSGYDMIPRFMQRRQPVATLQLRR
ncbi:MAG TPA: carboxypeptidase-like regulatory domain-containing protein [Gemmatimonadaceae bacterium]|nr:carboxypeptidase-like regulatory domain-containing protein [Gemmatimonadaceae bacterium]